MQGRIRRRRERSYIRHFTLSLQNAQPWAGTIVHDSASAYPALPGPRLKSVALVDPGGRADTRRPVRLSPDCPVSWDQSPARSLRVTTPLEVRSSALLPAAVQHLTTLMKGSPPLRCCPPSSGHKLVWLSPRPRSAVGGVGDVPPRRGRLSGVSTRFRPARHRHGQRAPAFSCRSAVATPEWPEPCSCRSKLTPTGRGGDQLFAMTQSR